MRILFLARSLETGGAERQLANLAHGLLERGHEVRVALFYPAGALRKETEEGGVPLVDLGKRSRWDLAGFLAKAGRAIRAFRPEIVHGYLVAPNLLSLLARVWAPEASIVWGVRASDMDFSRYDTLSKTTFALSIPLSRLSDLVIANSEAGRRFHVARGFPAERCVVVPNGIDTTRFRPDRSLGLPLRARWGAGPEDRVAGIVGRADPMKDHETFLAAAEIAAAREPRLRFVSVGPDGLSRIDRLRSLPAARRLGARLLWGGETAEMAAVYNAFDLLVLSSAFGEGFPNAVAEGMACGLPCAVTDVGDAARLVGDTGVVVPARDPASLASAILRLARSGTPAPREETRRRIETEFSQDALVARTEAALLRLRRERRP
jgi:glycosyltransferase involved in cell wall biosynthesis